MEIDEREGKGTANGQKMRERRQTRHRERRREQTGGVGKRQRET